MQSEDVKTYFGVADFTVFFGALLSSVLIGVYFGYKDRNKKTTETYYYGDRHVSPFAVAMSMSVSYVSAITVIGFPVETYFYGITFMWIIVATLIAAIFASVYYIPMLFRMQLKSTFELLEFRYNKMIRRLCSAIVAFQLIVYMGITIYLPALALNSVTPIQLEWSIVMTSVICTFYTTLGGIKAVIWTDVLQAFIMVFGALGLFIKSTIDIGGIDNVMTAAEEGGRLNFFNFNADIRQRSSVSSYFLGYFIALLDVSCFSQIFVQRYLSCQSVSDARKASMFRVIPMCMLIILAALDGLAMYAYYEGCDPYKAGLVEKKDELTARFSVEVFRNIPGLAGLFVSAAYSGTLSTVSSGINALAAMTTEDFIFPQWPNISAIKKALLAKLLSVFFGCLVTGVAYLVSTLQSTVVQIGVSLLGMFAGPTFSVFFIGTLFPWVNSKGAFGGMVMGAAVACWCSLGAIIYEAAPEFSQTLPTSVEECYLNSTTTMSMTTTAEIIQYRPPLADTWYSVSPFLYSTIGFTVSTVCMFVISGITGFAKPSEMEPKLFVPLIDNKKIFPKKVVKFFRFGVREIEEVKPGEETVPLKERSDFT